MTVTWLHVRLLASRYQSFLGVPETIHPKTNNLTHHVLYRHVLRKHYVLLSSEAREGAGIAADREAPHPDRLRTTTTYVQVCRPGYPMPAQRQAEVRGTLTHAQLSVPYHQLTLCSFLRHWERQRQLIAVTCIAEHA